MSLILDGTNGVSDIDGSAATPAIRGTDTNTGIFFPAADTIAFAEGGSEAMRLDSNGRLGINLTSPSQPLDVAGSAQLSFAGGNNYLYFQSTNNYIGRDGTTGDYWLNCVGGQNMIFGISTGEKMRINASGQVIVGTTANGANANFEVFKSSGIVCYFYSTGGTGVYLGAGGTSWTASSDERLKTDLKPIENAINKINTLRSVTGRYKTDSEETSRAFLIAQDVQAVLPEAVSVQDDELQTLGVQYTEVIPLLVASIKELNAKVDAQSTTIQELKATVDAQAARIAALEATGDTP
jgi:hypothetical protein